MHSFQIKDDPEENAGNRFTIGELNSNQGFVPAFPHFCLKKQLHSNDRGLMNEPKLTIDECKTLPKSLQVGGEFGLKKNAFSSCKT